MIIQITGGTGFVGQNLINYLSENNYEVENLSLRNEDWVKNINPNSHALIHLAGKAHDTSNVSVPEEYYKVNRDLTIDLFNYFLNSNIKDFFYFSSVKAAADTVDDVLTEDINCDPCTAYGKSKLQAENYLINKILPKGKRLFIIRPCMIHGPGNKGNLNLLFEMVKKGIPWPLGAFENKRSFLSIGNLNFLIDQILLNPDVKSGIYNFSDDGVISTNELINLISNVLGKKIIILDVKRGVIEKLAKIGDRFSLPLNSERLKKLTESYVVSNQKIKEAILIDRLPININDGLAKTIASFKSKGV